jgi:hypothetical protein
MSGPASPLLDPSTSPHDVRQRAVVQRVSDAERAHILALPSNDPLDPKLRFRVEATGPELFSQPAAIRATLQLNATPVDEIAHLIY